MSEINKPSRILRLKEVVHRTGLSRSSVYKFIDNATFPRSVALGARRVGWLEHTIDAWIEEKASSSVANNC